MSTIVYVVAYDADYQLGDETSVVKSDLAAAAAHANKVMEESRVKIASPLYVFEVTIAPKLIARQTTSVKVEEFRGVDPQSQSADR